jgi:hypothetical protein
MSREALQESLSAVMDNEADELELRRVLNAFDDVETCYFRAWTSLRPFLLHWLMKPYRRKPPVVHGVAWVAWL